jgi:FkbM family methyltransferase
MSPQPISHYVQRIREDGVRTIVRRRLRWYGGTAFRTARAWRNEMAGRFVERTGNRVRIAGLTFSVDSPLIATSQKGEMLFGLCESEERALLARSLRVDLPVVEFGGGMGVIACSTNRKLVHPDRHIVVEANSGMIPVLERNRDMNSCRFQVVNKALAYDSESVDFPVNPRFTASRIGGTTAGGVAMSVPTTSVAATADAAGFDQFTLICDIEGAEAALVETELDTLRRRVRFFLVEIHPGILGDDTVGRIVQTIQKAGFSLQDRHGINWAFSHD